MAPPYFKTSPWPISLIRLARVPAPPINMTASALATTVLFSSVLLLLYLIYLNTLPIHILLFPPLALLYFLFANHYILNSRLPAPPLFRRSLSPRRSARLLFPFTFLFSLLLPILLLSTPSLRPILAPHLFLITCQILLESVFTLNYTRITVYVRLLLTISFVIYRIPVLVNQYTNISDWTIYNSASPLCLPLQAISIINIVFWTFSLLCYLLLYTLPSVCTNPISK